MDNINEIHDYYEQTRHEANEYSESVSSCLHRQNINQLKNDRKQLIDRFRGLYVRAFRIISPKLNDMNRLVYVSAVGGHIYVKEPGYQSLYAQYLSVVNEVIMCYKLIQYSNADITAEYDLIYKEKDQRISNDFSFYEALSQPIQNITSEQLTLTL